MNNKKNKLRFLSQSVLLEEAGLPKINTAIIIVVFLLVFSFIFWSLNMKIDEIIVVEGHVIQSENSDSVDINANIPVSDIAAVSVGNDVTVQIPRNKDNMSIRGNISYIEKTSRTDKKNNKYYVAEINLNDDSFQQKKAFILPGMVADIEIIIGNRSLFNYLLGSIYRVQENAFKK